MRSIEAIPNTYPDVSLSDRQWDVVRNALMQRGTKEAERICERIWGQLVPQRLRHMDGRCRCHPTAQRDDSAVHTESHKEL